MASIDFGTVPGTGDRLPDALKKLQNRLNGLEGVTTSLAVVNKEFSGVSGQTVFTADVDFFIGSAEVFLNGLRLNASDFSFTNTKTVILTTALKSDGTLQVFSTGIAKA